MRGIVGRAKCGVKRSVLTDGRGVPVAGVLDGANRVEPRGSPDDHTLMRETLDAIALPRPSPLGDPPAKRLVAEPPEGTMPGRPQHLCLDKGYDPAVPCEIAAEFSFTLHLHIHGEEVAAKRHAGARARRWVIERAHSWLNSFRAVLIRWNKRPKNDLALLLFAFGIIAWRHDLPGLVPAGDVASAAAAADHRLP